jgi:dipeptide/tripeptide permease
VLAVGAAGARRFTAWFGAALVAQGVVVLVGEALGDGASTLVASMVFLLVGIGVVCIAHLLATFLAEPDEEDELRSLTPRTRREPGTGPALDDEAALP